jgi:hypothetical protein
MDSGSWNKRVENYSKYEYNGIYEYILSQALFCLWHFQENWAWRYLIFQFPQEIGDRL